MLFERGLAYQAESDVNYDPVDRTVLANEQVCTILRLLAGLVLTCQGRCEWLFMEVRREGAEDSAETMVLAHQCV